MEFVDETPSELIEELPTIACGLERTEQEWDLQESKTLRVEDEHNVRVIVQSRVPSVRVKGLGKSYNIIPGRKGKKGEKVVVFGVGQEWTDQHPPITILSGTDSDSDTDRGSQAVKFYQRTSNTLSDSDDQCGLEHRMPIKRNVGDMFDQKSTQRGEKSDIFCEQANAGTSTTTYREVDKSYTMASEMESNLEFAEGEVAICQPKQKIVDSQEYMVISTDFEKRTMESTDNMSFEDRRKSFFQAKGNEPLCNGSTVLALSDSECEDERVYGKGCRLNRAENSYGKTLPSPSKPQPNIKEPPARSCELDSSPSDCKFHNGDLLSLDPRTRMYRLREMFHERRRFYNIEEDNRIRVAGKGTQGTRSRSDLKAYTYVKKQVMALKGFNTVIGEIPGIEVGDYFYYRIELLLLGIHRQIQGGIDFIATTGQKLKFFDRNGKPVAVAVSVVSSEGGGKKNSYEGDSLIYSGQGSSSADQKLVRGNLALKNSCDLGLSVRVVLGVEVRKGEAPINFERVPGVCSPSGFVYIYDGLYNVENYSQDVGSGGFNVWKFKLVRQPGQKNITDFLKGLL